MKPYYETKLGKLYHGEHPHAMRDIPDNTFDSIVTDPPYGFRFMGKKWDYNVPSVEIWKEHFRVLKPGGFLLSFAGTRTQHRMAVNIEDAGFEIRDMIGWLYGSGFPKSLNIGKAIDKSAGLEREVVGQNQDILKKQASDIKNGSRKILDSFNSGAPNRNNGFKTVSADITAPASPEAQQWEGWGTALKPALEPITVARKPVEGTVANNVLKYGTGGINIDESRIEGEPHHNYGRTCSGGIYTGQSDKPINTPPQGRFPANIIHDGSDEVLAIFPHTQSGSRPDGFNGEYKAHIYGKFQNNRINPETVYADNGSAARFFYCAKASKQDRGKGNTWPTVKPQSLMKYLIKLVTPPGGTVLDGFGGSGTTAIACEELGFKWVLFDMKIAAVKIAAKRLEQETAQLKLFTNNSWVNNGQTNSTQTGNGKADGSKCLMEAASRFELDAT